LDTAISTDVVISLKPNGTAIYNSDFIADFLKGTATTVAEWKRAGGAMNQLYPSDVSVASDGTIYVLDPNNGRIQNGDRLLQGTTVTNVSGIHAFQSIFQNIYGLDSGVIIVFRNGLLAERPEQLLLEKWSRG
jgi:hypothetical protein